MSRRLRVTGRPVFVAKTKGKEMANSIDECIDECLQGLLGEFEGMDFEIESLNITPISAADGTLVHVCLIGGQWDDEEEELEEWQTPTTNENEDENSN